MQRAPLVLLVTLAACGDGTSAGDAGAQVDLAPAAGTCISDGKPVALASRYAIQGRLNVNIKVPGIYDKDAPSGLLLLADINQSGSAVTVKASTCQILLPPVALNGQPMPTQLTVPDVLVQAVPVVSTTAQLAGDKTCAGLATMPLAIVLGARLAIPATDPVPTYDRMAGAKLCGGKVSTRCSEATDVGCICDQEADGKPGATVAASGVPALDDVDQIYLGLRTAFTLDGLVFPPGTASAQRIKGRVMGFSLDQSPVGCHRAGTGGAGSDCDAQATAAVALLNPKITQSVNNVSTFVAVPVPDTVGCVEAVAQAGTLFAGQW